MPGAGYSPEYDFDANKPAGNTYIADGDNWMRSNYGHIDNALAEEHYAPSNDPDASEQDFGRHDFITLKEQTSKPPMSGLTNRHAIYPKSDGLYFEKDDGTEVMLIAFDTNKVPTESVEAHDIPVDTIVLFESDTAVAGYTLLNAVDDALVYISKGSAAGGETGRTFHSTGTWTQPSHTLTVDEMPLHGHPVRYDSQSSGSSDGAGGIMLNGDSDTNYSAFTDTPTATRGEQIGGTGGGTAHNHGDTWRPRARVFTRQRRA